MMNNEEDPRREKVQCTNCDSVKMQLEENQKQLAENQKKLSENQVQLAEHQKQLDDSRNQIEALRTEISELKVKQQADTDGNRNSFEKFRARIIKQSRDKQAKDVQMNPVVENESKTELEKPVPEAAPPAQSAPPGSPAPPASQVSEPPASSELSTSPAPPAPPAPSKVSQPPAPSALPRSPAPPATPVPPASSKVSEPPAPSALSTSPAPPATPAPPVSTEVSDPPASPAVSTVSEPLYDPPKPRSLHEKFAGIWKIVSTKDCDHYINFQKLDKDDYLKDLDIECDGTWLQIPPEPELIANPSLITETRFQDNTLLTVLSKEGAEKIDDIVITRTLKSDNQMVVKTVFNAFYNLTHSRQFSISDTNNNRNFSKRLQALEEKQNEIISVQKSHQESFKNAFSEITEIQKKMTTKENESDRFQSNLTQEFYGFRETIKEEQNNQNDQLQSLQIQQDQFSESIQKLSEELAEVKMAKNDDINNQKKSKMEHTKVTEELEEIKKKQETYDTFNEQVIKEIRAMKREINAFAKKEEEELNKKITPIEKEIAGIWKPSSEYKHYVNEGDPIKRSHWLSGQLLYSLDSNQFTYKLIVNTDEMKDVVKETTVQLGKPKKYRDHTETFSFVNNHLVIEFKNRTDESITKKYFQFFLDGKLHIVYHDLVNDVTSTRIYERVI
ncbi:hypothetical protein CAEBREN_11630 [Caenorhabditis brenneri]|uniref:Uncharacterized protein n=1 Tax=Caenorhabditis brenneri TaxID=135651 RepID=G0PDF1_CAEBE|nr:hypothetical protein CAEBREN_11630 [Caenorhabditis brenneri]